MKARLARIGARVADTTARLFAPDLARLGDRCEALRQEGEDLRAALAGELPAAHPMSRHVAAFRRAHGGTGGGAR